MKKFNKVVEIKDGLIFDDGTILTSYHDQDCCEIHELDFSNIELNEFDGLEFNLDPANDGEAFFRRIPEYGIELIPVKGHSVKIPGYGYNNGYYSDNLEISLTRPGEECIYFDITECQEQKDY